MPRRAARAGRALRDAIEAMDPRQRMGEREGGGVGYKSSDVAPHINPWGSYGPFHSKSCLIRMRSVRP